MRVPGRHHQPILTCSQVQGEHQFVNYPGPLPGGFHRNQQGYHSGEMHALRFKLPSCMSCVHVRPHKQHMLQDFSHELQICNYHISILSGKPKSLHLHWLPVLNCACAGPCHKLLKKLGRKRKLCPRGEGGDPQPQTCTQHQKV